MPRSWDWVAVSWAVTLISLSLLGAGWILAVGSTDDDAETGAVTASAATDVFRVARAAEDILLIAEAPPGGPVKIRAIPGDSSRLPLDAVSVSLSSRSVPRLTSCGWNCFRVDEAVMLGEPAALRVGIRRASSEARAVIPMPATLPPRGDELFRTMTRRMRKIRTVQIDETLGNGRTTLRTRFLFQAPDRMSYRMASGPRAVVIGSRRWDWLRGRWDRSTTDPIPAPAYSWTGARDPFLLGTTTLRGRPARILSVFRDDSRVPAWFRLLIDEDDRVVRADMLSVAHFMVDRLSRYDAPVSIDPPS